MHSDDSTVAPGGAAAVAPSPAPVSAAANPLPTTTDSPTDATGRRILSTAFVQVGPDRLLTVVTRDGQEHLLRDVAMGPRDYCGTAVTGTARKGRFCGAYADVVSARPGGAPAPAASNSAAPGSLPTG